LSLTVANQVISLSAPKIMGILNVTEDSFYDGGLYNSTENAVLQAKKMLEDGADFIDIGGESTRPGAQPIDSKTECERVIPIIREIRKWSKIPISIDTSKAEVAGKAIEAGADIINDISALRFDDKMLEVLQKNPHVPVILMHMQGTPQTMQEAPFYNDTIDEIISFFEERISFCEKNGVNRERIILDPGIGFGKRQKDNLLILKKLADFHIFQLPVLLGTSRKSFINGIYPSPAQNRLEGSLATTALAYQNHVQIIRVHDVLEHKRMIQTLQAIDEVL
jgi:dihydropteroate synthase